MEQEMIIGKNPVIEALTAGRPVNKVVVSDQLNKSLTGKLNHLAKDAGTVCKRCQK